MTPTKYDLSESGVRELEPCPFCGELPEMKGATIGCKNLKCWGPSIWHMSNPTDSIEAWNRRARHKDRTGEAVAWRFKRYDGIDWDVTFDAGEATRIADFSGEYVIEPLYATPSTPSTAAEGEVTETVAKLRTKRMRVHDLSGVGWELDPDCQAAASLLSRVAGERDAVLAHLAARPKSMLQVAQMHKDATERAAKAEARAEAAEASLAQSDGDVIALNIRADRLERQISELRDTLEEVDGILSCIRDDYTDPRSECREGRALIQAALSGGTE